MSGHDSPVPVDRDRLREYAAPPRMIAECTAARERGDWAAACAAAEIAVTFDAGSLTRRFGPEVAAGLLETLAGFAPDLLRWHLPTDPGERWARATTKEYLLCPDAPADPGGAVLVIRCMIGTTGAQRFVLSAFQLADLLTELPAGADPPRPIRLAPHFWDARRSGELRAAVGGSAERVPGFTPDGQPLPPGPAPTEPRPAESLPARSVPAEPPSVGLLPAERRGAGDDRPVRAERAMVAVDPAPVWRAAGLSVTRGPDAWRLDREVARRLDPYALVAEARRVSAQLGCRTLALWFGRSRLLRLDVEPGTVHATTVDVDWTDHDETRRLPTLSFAMLRFSPDLELVRSGRLAAGALHPLVRAALFPAAEPMDPGPVTLGTEPIPVRCGDDRHLVEHRSGRLCLTAHTEAELLRERALGAFGGPVTGCVAVGEAWHGGSGDLPEPLLTHRDELWRRMTYGGTGVVLDLLDAGLDPLIRDRSGRTLLHHLEWFDHERLLPRLLAAGLAVDVRDAGGSTALHLAVQDAWPPALIRALVDAGADPHAVDVHGRSVLARAGYFVSSEDPLGEDFPHPDRTRGPAFRSAIDHLKEHA